MATILFGNQRVKTTLIDLNKKKNQDNGTVLYFNNMYWRPSMFTRNAHVTGMDIDLYVWDINMAGIIWLLTVVISQIWQNCPSCSYNYFWVISLVCLSVSLSICLHDYVWFPYATFPMGGGGTLVGVNEYKFHYCLKSADHHDDVIKWTISAILAFCAGNSPVTGHRWIPHTKASGAELWCFLWSAPE